MQHIEEEFLRGDLELTPQALGEYASLCATIGREVGFSRGGQTLCGIAEDVEKNGALLVRLPGGETVSVSSGEVTAQGIY